MAFRDLREYLAKLEAEGEVQHIAEEVDWDLEVGAIIRRSYDLRAPAPLFEKIRGYPKGYRIFGAPAGLSRPGREYARIALALGMSPEAKVGEIVEEYIRRKKAPLKPIIVGSGPCKESVLTGDKVDLLKFPAPLLHDGDGGRYIGTWHLVATRDPDSGWTNWGLYRLMVHDSTSMGGLVAPAQHIGMMYYRKYEARNQPMPFAVAIGTDPVSPLIAGAFIPVGVNEVDVIGGLRGEPVQLVKCETVDLEVPATAEIVIEGVMHPHERKDEGPFGEYTGYRSAHAGSPKPVYRVKAITHRNDPILTLSCTGVPVDDNQAALAVVLAAEVLDDLRGRGFLVKMVAVPPECASHIAVVQTQTPYPYFAKKIAHAIWGSAAGSILYWVVVVDEEVDATNLNEVLHCLFTRCHPDRGVFQVPRAPIYPNISTFTDPEDRVTGRGAYCLFDATWPKHWKPEDTPVKASFDVSWPRDVREKVLSRWKKYGYRE
ncbi:MAG TPA: UbiD family decarboxylase [Dehalococcoidia bacterium]|nr:UbiD family decarboxylase [Dehalococcoidia bacterium]